MYACVYIYSYKEKDICLYYAYDPHTRFVGIQGPIPQRPSHPPCPLCAGSGFFCKLPGANCPALIT